MARRRGRSPGLSPVGLGGTYTPPPEVVRVDEETGKIPVELMPVDVPEVLPGTSLATVSNIPLFPAAGAPALVGTDTVWEIPGSMSPIVTVPPSGRMEVEAHCPWLTGNTVGAAFGLYVVEHNVVNGVAETQAQARVRGLPAYVAASFVYVGTAGKGSAVHPSGPFEREPGDEFVYSLMIHRISGNGVPSFTNLGYGQSFLDIKAR